MPGTRHLQPVDGWPGNLPGGDPVRRRTSQACLPCGRRKTKCDGGVPVCWQCETNARECVYGYSKRNKRQKRNEAPAAVGCGPSQLPLSPPALLSEQYSTGQQASPATPTDGGQPGLDVSVAVSKHLFTGFFSYIHPVWPILYKPLYDAADYEALSRKLPRAVVYAIYALAASLDLGPVSGGAANDVPAPALFLQAAWHSIHNDGAAAQQQTAALPGVPPSLDRCQALTLLALQQHCYADGPLASKLTTLAMEMALDLGLHRTGAEDDEHDEIAAQIKSRIWWTLFILEKMVACGLSRPMLLKSEDTNTPYPSTHEADEYELLQLSRPGDTTAAVSTKAHTLSGFHLTIKLVKIMEHAARKIYSAGSREAIRMDPRSRTHEMLRLGLWAELKDYHAVLLGNASGSAAPAFDIDTFVHKTVPPYLLINVILTWTYIILVHRPFWPPRRDESAMRFAPVQEAYAADVDPLRISFAAAQTIFRILEAHADNLHRFPCDMGFSMYTAANTLSHYRSVHSGAADVDYDYIASRLEMCVTWLVALDRSWRRVFRSREELRKAIGLPEHETATATHPVRPGTRDPPLEAAALGSALMGPGLLQREHTPRSDSHGRNFLDVLGGKDDEFYAAIPDFRFYFEPWT